MRPLKTAGIVGGILVALLWLSAPAVAQEDPSLIIDEGVIQPQYQDAVQEDLAFAPDNFGIDDGNDHWVPAAEFAPRTAGADWDYQSYHYWYNTGGSTQQYEAVVKLPNGALVRGYRVYYQDSHASYNMGSIQMWRFWSQGSSRSLESIGPSYTSSGTPGVTDYYVDFNPDYTMVSRTGLQDNIFTLVLNMPPTSSVTFKGARVFWQRQISPAPASATFGDVPVGAFGFQHVEALVDSGITAGCGGGNFCPNQALTRVQMAIFLSKALGLHWPAF